MLATLACTIIVAALARGRMAEVYEVLLVGPGLVIANVFTKAWYAHVLDRRTNVRNPRVARLMPNLVMIAAYSATFNALVPIVVFILAYIGWSQLLVVERHWAASAAACVFGEVFFEWGFKLWVRMLPASNRQQLLHINKMQRRQVGLLHIARIDLLFGRAPNAQERKLLVNVCCYIVIIVFGGLSEFVLQVVFKAGICAFMKHIAHTG